MMTKNKNYKQKNISTLDFDDFALPCIQITSNKEAVVDGCKGVIEYNNAAVRINCCKILLKFTGYDLSIKTVTTEQYIVTGDITSIEFFSC